MSGIFTEITAVCDSDTESTTVNGIALSEGESCKFDDGTNLTIWTTHFTASVTIKRSSSQTTTSGGDDSAFTSDYTPSGTYIDPSKPGFGGILSSGLTIHEVSYDVCSKNIIQIIVSSDDSTPPIVKIETPNSGVIYAKLAAEQPFAEQNESSSVGIYVFESWMVDEESFTITVLKTENAALSTKSTIKVTSCEDTIILYPLPTPKEEIVPSAPKIFDVKVKAEGKLIRAVDVIDEFVNANKPLTVSAIIDSPTPIRAELRFITLGEPVSQYTSVEMIIEPFAALESTYIVNASIPSAMLQGPAASYWIHVVNDESLVAKYASHIIDIKPDGINDLVIVLDSIQNISGRSSYSPIAYITNPSDVPVYGKVSLLADGQKVSTANVLLSPGESVIKLNWFTPSTKKLVSYDISAKLDLYGESIETKPFTLYTFAETQIAALSEFETINTITNEKGNTVAVPYMIYSSLKEGSLDYTVIAPDGTCVIGSSEQCLVSGSTFESRVDSESVILDNQVYRIRYSGPDNVLERFSITSIDPIVGQWTIEHEPKDNLIQQAHAMQDGIVKIKYTAQNTPLITVSSD